MTDRRPLLSGLSVVVNLHAFPRLLHQYFPYSFHPFYALIQGQNLFIFPLLATFKGGLTCHSEVKLLSCLFSWTERSESTFFLYQFPLLMVVFFFFFPPKKYAENDESTFCSSHTLLFKIMKNNGKEKIHHLGNNLTQLLLPIQQQKYNSQNYQLFMKEKIT